MPGFDLNSAVAVDESNAQQSIITTSFDLTSAQEVPDVAPAAAIDPHQDRINRGLDSVNPDAKQKHPIAAFLRWITRESAIESLNRQAWVASHPEVLDKVSNASWGDLNKVYEDAIKPYEDEQINKGVIHQVEAPMMFAMGAGAIAAPVATAVGLAGFTALDKIGNLRNFTEKQFPDAPPAFQEAAEIVDFVAKGAVVGGGMHFGKDIPMVKKFVNDGLRNASVQPATYIKPEQLTAINSSTILTPAEKLDIMATTGIEQHHIEASLSKGVPIKVPMEKLVDLASKPYWETLKQEMTKSPTPVAVQDVTFERRPTGNVQDIVAASGDKVGEISFNTVDKPDVAQDFIIRVNAINRNQGIAISAIKNVFDSGVNEITGHFGYDRPIAFWEKLGGKVVDNKVTLSKASFEDYLSTKEGYKSANVSSGNDASSVISYVTPAGEKVFTRISVNELRALRDEVKNIPTPPQGEAQIHLDAITPNLLKNGKELTREEFIKGHSQVADVLGKASEATFPAPKFNYFSDAEMKDIKGVYDWEIMQEGGGMHVSGGGQNGLERVVTYQQSGHSKTMQSITPKKSFELLKKAQSGEKMTEKQIANVKRLVEDFRQNIKEHIAELDKEIADVTKQLSESEAKAVNDAFEKEAQTHEYDINGNIIDQKPQEVSPFNDAPTGLTAIPGDGVAKPRTLAQGVAEKAVAENLTKGFGDIPEYNTVNMAAQAKKASDLLSTNPDQALKIAMGEEAPPAGIIPEAVFVAVENKAILEGDVNTLRDLATASRLSTEATTMGQRIRTLGERDPESPVGAIKEVQAAREKGIESKMGKGGNMKKALMAEAKQIKESMRKAAPKKQDWQGFIESLEC